MENLILFGSLETPLNIGAKTTHCFVLENKQRVITISSLQKALGYDGKFENWLFEFLSDINIYQPITEDLLNSFEKPIKILNPTNASDFINTIVSKNIFETCQIIIKAKNEGFLNASQVKFSKEALFILENIKNKSIEDLIDEATGFTIYKKIAIEKTALNLKTQLDDAAFYWIKTFPDSFFEIMFEMNNLNWKDLLNEQKKIGELLSELIFSRIDEALLAALRLSTPKRTYKRSNNKKQDKEHPKLKEHLAILQSYAKVSGYNWNIFIQLINKSFPEHKNRMVKKLKLAENVQTKNNSLFNEKLKKSLVFKAK